MAIALMQGDCLELLKKVKPNSVSLIATDLPYGKTQNSWDIQIDIKRLWEEYYRVLKPNGVVALNAMQPFTSLVVVSNIRDFKYEYIWNKSSPTGFLNAKRQPLRVHESIVIFYRATPTYNAQVIEGKPYIKTRPNRTTSNYNPIADTTHGEIITTRNPITILHIPRITIGTLHPTQKPIELYDFLIRTYTNEGDIVLDSCGGVFSSGVSAVLNKRHYIGIELRKDYFDLGVERIKNAK